MLTEFGCPWPTMMLNGTCTNAICRSGAGQLRIGLAEERRLREVLTSLRHRLRALPGSRPVRTWLWKFSPTPGGGASTSIAVVAELAHRADAREQEQVRRLDRARADDDLAPRTHLDLLAVLDVLDADAAVVLDQEPRRVRVRADGQVLSGTRPGRGSPPSCSNALPVLTLMWCQPAPSICGPLKSSVVGKPSS